MAAPPAEIRTILATDCGSTTKAILIEKQGDEAPTTIGAPFDLAHGVLNAVREAEELSGRPHIGPDGRTFDRRLATHGFYSRR